MDVPTLESERLCLVPLSLDDAPAIQRHFPHWEIIQNLSHKVPWPYPEDGALSYLRDSALPAMADGSEMIWGLRLKSDPSELIGALSYLHVDTGMGNRGFWLAKHLHGQGYMTEAVTCFQDFVFFELGVPEIVVANAKGNTASRRIKEKTGARLLDEIQLTHHSGQQVAERWVVTREAWGELRGRALDGPP